MYCTNCGYKLSDTAKYCSNCGIDLQNKSQFQTQNSASSKKMYAEKNIHSKLSSSVYIFDPIFRLLFGCISIIISFYVFSQAYEITMNDLIAVNAKGIHVLAMFGCLFSGIAGVIATLTYKSNFLLFLVFSFILYFVSAFCFLSSVDIAAKYSFWGFISIFLGIYFFGCFVQMIQETIKK